MFKLKNVLAALAILPGCYSMAGMAESGSAPAKPQTAINAEDIYRENCAICHGDNGDGNTRTRSGLRPPPRNFTTMTAAMELTRERMIQSVTYGRKGTGMMAHKDRLTPEEIASVVDYIREHFMQTPQNNPQIAEQVEAEKIYSRNCAVCHGDKGNGAIWTRGGLNPPPRNFSTEQARQELTRERMINSVTNGRPGTAMQPHKGKLSESEIASVVDFIRATFMTDEAIASNSETPSLTPQLATTRQHPSVPGYPMPGAGGQGFHRPGNGTNPHQAPHQGGIPGVVAPTGSGVPAALTETTTLPPVVVDMSVPLPKGLKGDVAKGREFYMNNCFTCHGVQGDGNGPRASFNIPRPRDFTSAMSRRVLNRERVFNSVTDGRVGTVMPAWGKVLNDQQIADVAEFVFETFINMADAKAEDAKKKAN